MSTSNPPTGAALRTLDDDGSLPESRLNDALEVSNWVETLIRANEDRDRLFATVKGMVDGNPPFRSSELRKQGMAWRSNFNDRSAEAFLATGKDAFYDIFAEAPTFATCEAREGEEQDLERMSKIVTEEYQRLNQDDDTFDPNMQLSQYEMTLYGLGPIMWEDEYDWRGRSIECGRLLLPDRTPSRLSLWEACAVLVDYLPHQLYGFIRKPREAEERGWKVETVKKAIASAQPSSNSTSPNPWIDIQQRLRNNDLCASAQSSVIQTVHVFYREFPVRDDVEGKISHCIIVRDRAQTNQVKNEKDFLYRKLRRFDSWKNLICPFYYDTGDGTHHSVKGMGVKFYSLLDTHNRLNNAVVDGAHAGMAIHLRPTTMDAFQQWQVAYLGPYSVLRPGMESVPINTAGNLVPAMQVSREMMSTVTSNLSQYRQNLMSKEGNPITAREVQWRAEQMSLLGKTQLNRYYAQLDAFFQERFRRAINTKLVSGLPGAKEALEFQERCRNRGVPRRSLETMRVFATRVAGQGNPFLRGIVLQELLATVGGSIGEVGLTNLIEDYIAAKSGTRMARRYYSQSDRQEPATQHHWQATIENGQFKEGNPVPVVDGQNHVVHLQIHMNAQVQAINSVQQGGDAAQVILFLDLSGPHNAAHLQLLSRDKLRQDIFKMLQKQFQEIADLTDKLKEQVQKRVQEQQGQRTEQLNAQAIMQSDAAMKAASHQQDMRIKQEQWDLDKSRQLQNLTIEQVRARQRLALDDAETAASMAREAKLPAVP